MSFIRVKDGRTGAGRRLLVGLLLAGALPGCWGSAFGDCMKRCNEVPEKRQRGQNMVPGDCSKQCYVSYSRH